MIGGSIGAAALLASQLLLPDSASAFASTVRRGIRAPARGRPPGEHLAAGTPQAAQAGLHGATLALTSYPQGDTWAEAVAQWQNSTGTLIRTCKVYHDPGDFPATASPYLRAMAGAGVKAMLCFKPAFNPVSASDLQALKKTLAAYKQVHLEADVTLWQEPQDWDNHLSASQYVAMVQYYGPTVRKFYQLAYDAAGDDGASGWTTYYPGDAWVDIVAVDFYAHRYVTGDRLDVIAGLADNAQPAPKPFGIWEMGNTTTKGANPTQAQMEEYFAYLQSYMSGRLAAGNPNAEIAWYNGGVNAIQSSSDYRAALWRQLVDATFG